MNEEFNSCQLRTICLCGNPKEFGNYVCATCWHHVPEDLKKDLFWTGFKHENGLLKRVEAIASSRNPDSIGRTM